MFGHDEHEGPLESWGTGHRRAAVPCCVAPREESAGSLGHRAGPILSTVVSLEDQHLLHRMVQGT